MTETSTLTERTALMVDYLELTGAPPVVIERARQLFAEHEATAAECDALTTQVAELEATVAQMSRELAEARATVIKFQDALAAAPGTAPLMQVTACQDPQSLIKARVGESTPTGFPALPDYIEIKYYRPGLWAWQCKEHDWATGAGHDETWVRTKWSVKHVAEHHTQPNSKERIDA